MFAVASLPVHGAASCGESVGQVVSVENTVQVKPNDLERWDSAETNQRLCEGDTIRVGENSRTAVRLINDAVLRLDENTTMRLLNVAGAKQEQSFLEVLSGTLKSFIRKPRTMSVSTPYVNGSIEGTEFLVQVTNDKSSFLVLEGRILAQNDHGNVQLQSGEMAVAGAGEAPQKQIVVRPRDAVQWALHYPAVLMWQDQGFPADAEWSDAVKRSLEYYVAGDITNAFASIADTAGAASDPRFLTYRATLLLAVGRVQDALEDVERSLSLAPGSSDALALQAVIAVSQNDKEKALAAATQAISNNAKSASALIALSYAQQAAFDLDSARTSVENAVQLEPENALAWARLAELRSSFGLLDEALEAATKATAIEPRLSRTQTVLGFAHLTQVKTTLAKDAFTAAISLDQSDPLPRLGLGLAQIAEGDLQAGRGQIDVAVSLDPNQSIIRSYLGKAYFEEKRGPLDEQQYRIAMDLDPNDPTPWFYEAIGLQTTNRPVEALKSLKKAIELNDNRAVYRSRLLLDADLAARSASLARVFSDLGFQQLALVEGWKSVNTDPSNFSSHRFLADSYAARPRHEIARVSELLQSQLLQPLSMTPIQPRLGESDLFLVSAGGAGGLSFNEFNPLFQRSGINMQASGLVGGNDTRSGEAVISGVMNNIAFSVGAFHFETDGFRPNADQEDDIFNAFVQIELSPDTSLQAEYRYRDNEIGDLQLRFFPEEFFPAQRTPLEIHSFRLGARHTISPSSVLLGSLIYSDAEFGAFDRQPLFAPGFITFIGLDEPQEAISGEVQYLFRSARFNLTAGGGYLERDSTSDFLARTVLPPPDDVLAFPTEDTDLRQGTVYGYLNLKPIDTVTMTLGLSAEFSNGDSDAEDGDNEVNPKFGLMWNPLPRTLLRAAAFKTTKRPVISNQTLEPTQVAGFNQFYDDFNFTTSWRYGVALDQTFSTELYGGVEVSRRDQDVPASDQFGASIISKWQDDLARAYLFWTPHRWWGLKAEVEFENLERDLELTDGLQESDTLRVPLGVTFRHPSGLGAAVTATYFDQDGTFESIVTGALRNGTDEFWVADANLSFRLPKRYGFVSIGVSNIFDEEFRYFDTDFNNPSIRPDRVVFGSVTFAFP